MAFHLRPPVPAASSGDCRVTGPEMVPNLVHLALTAEQREVLRRASGHDVEAIELHTEGAGEHVRLKWRLSSSSGIPRQNWSDVELKKGP